MSKRSEVAERIAAKIREWKLTAPFGGDVTKDKRCYSILFASPRYLDGLVQVFSPTWILVQDVGPWALRGTSVYSSEQDALDYIQFAFIEHDTATALKVPVKVKPQKA